MRDHNWAYRVFIILWVFWIMLCVRFGFKIGLIGPGSRANDTSTALFAVIYCLIIPLSILILRKKSVSRLIWASIPFNMTGLLILLISNGIPLAVSSSLLAAGSALLTSSFLLVYAYLLSDHEQLLLIIAFLTSKPLFSLAAVLVSDYAGRLYYTLFATAVLICIIICTILISRSERPTDKPKDKNLTTAPYWTLLGVYILFSLIVFEKMNSVFALYEKGYSSQPAYFFYFAGGLAAASASWWLFFKHRFPVMLAFDIFIFAAIFQFVVAIAAGNGFAVLSGIDMIFFGISDIVYIFLFVTAASICKTYTGLPVFKGFAFVFGISLICGFGLSQLLYNSFRSIFYIVCALTSLLILAVSVLLAPVLRNLSNKMEAVPLKTMANCEKSSTEDAPSYGISDHERGDIKQSEDNKPNITTRENEIIRLYLNGFSNRQVADMLHISPGTVKVHSRNIYEKLKINSRVELFFHYRNRLNDIDS